MAELAQTSVETIVTEILAGIGSEREREILARRFGLYEPKQTLEQVGAFLGITRERVRQLEKSVIMSLRVAAEDSSHTISKIEKDLLRHLHELGGAARIHDVAARFYQTKNPSATQVARVSFLADLAPHVTTLPETDLHYQAAAIGTQHDEKQLKTHIDTAVKTITAHGEPLTTEELHEKLDHNHPDQVRAIASLSKHLSAFNDKWGLAKWPSVNPRTIRDKIFVVMQQSGEPMHFSEIASHIEAAGLSTHRVTTQAIHNELIKDERFILVGRGKYALADSGLKTGTVCDLMEEVLTGEKMLSRDEIMKRVLRIRDVRPTTIALNLQNKPQFRRVERGMYTLDLSAKVAAKKRGRKTARVAA